MNIQHVILGFLTQEPSTGYTIKQKMEESVSHFFDASYGAIYPALRKLEKELFIEKQVIVQDGKPNKHLYAITDKGKELFIEYLESPLNSTLIRSDLLIRVFFGKFTTISNIQDWLNAERERAYVQFEELKQVEKNIPNMDAFKKITLNYGINQAKFTVDWIDEELNKLKQEE